MILEIIYFVSTCGRKGRLVNVQCDHCEKQFQRKYLKAYVENDIHTCSIMCSNRCDRKKHKAIKTCQKKFGFDSAMKSESVKQNHRKTMQAKYGVDFACQIPHVYASAHSPISWAKSHKTKAKNGTYRRSWVEISFFEMLSKHTNVVTQVWLQPRYSLDAFITDSNCYIQFDGVHWHGLDDAKLMGITSHDKIILGKIKNDRELDNLVRDQKLRLIRITDLHFKKHRENAITDVLSLLSKEWDGVQYVGDSFAKHNLS